MMYFSFFKKMVLPLNWLITKQNISDIFTFVFTLSLSELTFSDKNPKH